MCLCTHCCSAKAVSITYSKCVYVAFSYPACNAHAPYCHLWPIQLYSTFPPYLINSMNLEIKVMEHKMHVLIFPTNLYEKSVILRRTEWNIIRNIDWSSCTVLLFLSELNKTWIFSRDFKKIHKYQISWDSVQWDPSCFMQTNRYDKVNSHLCQFCKRTKICNS